MKPLKYLFLSLFLLFSIGYSAVELREDTQLAGCDSVLITSSVYPQCDCSDGARLLNVNCDDEECECVCELPTSTRCSQTECSVGEERGVSCGEYNSYILVSGYQDRDSASAYTNCPYDKLKSVLVEPICSSDLTLFNLCIGGEWTTQISYTCSKVFCSETTAETVSCTKAEVEIEYEVEYTSGTTCSSGYERCEGLKITRCSDGNYGETGIQCPEVCCDINNKNKIDYCKRRSDISNKNAVCVNTASSDSFYTCPSENAYRCNEQTVEKCSNSVWQTFEN